ncbi:nuclear envelope pore membrane protein POM 121 isoform X2 [Bombina bombina]|uniref:nuclear envelope pore membrane protein POM 121 isoform X2 n=1 Tax=Bombina bombina TaxID=8345 RepID=UPI00235A7141|nr:nuclear envelope pore membrane protein POM 121 isoform X2 [Bombina bombina]
MCPGWLGGRDWDRLWRALWDSPGRRLLLVVGALLMLLFYLAPYFLVVAVVASCLAAYWGYLDSGRLLIGINFCKHLTSSFAGTAVLRQRQGLNQARRQRDLPTFKWSPSDLLLLMGSYLGKQEPPPRGVTRGSRDIKDKLARPNPAVPTPTRRLSFRETPSMPSRGYLSPRRRYPIHQPQYSMAGSLPMVCLDGYQRKALLSPRNSAVRSPVTIRIAPPDSKIPRSPVADNLLSPSMASPSIHNIPDPCAKETVLKAIKESRKRLNKDEEHSFGGLESKRSRTECLKRGINLQVDDDDHNSKRSRTSSISSLNNSLANGIPMSTRNAITSSYSSSRGLQKRKRAVQNTSVSSNASSRCQTPEWPVKKSREEDHETSLSTPEKSGSKDQSSGKSNNTPQTKTSSSIGSSDTGGSHGRRRKVLLVCSGRGEQYPLPPPPIIGYSVTSKDFDAEKKAALERLNKALAAPDTVPISSASTGTSALKVPVTFTLAATSVSPLESQTPTAGSNLLLQSLAKMQSQESTQATKSAVSVTQSTTQANTAAPSIALGSFGLGLNASETKPSIASTPSLSVSTVVTTASNTLTQTLLAQPKQEAPAPKNGLLFEILSKPEEKNLQTSFKPIFEPNQTTTPPSVALSSSTFSATTSSGSDSTFPKIFGNPDSHLASSSASSPFNFQMTSTSTSAPASAPISSFSSLSGTSTGLGIAKPSFAPSTSANSSTSSTTASTFQFGVASQSMSSSSGTTSILGNPVAAPEAKPAVPFGQIPTSQATAGFNLFGVAKAPVSTSQTQLSTAFGSTTSAFTAAFGTSTNTSAFSVNNSQTAFKVNSTSEVQPSKPTPTPIPSFGGSVGQPAFGTNTQPAFGNSQQPPFGTSAQPTFGGMNTTFNFGNSTAAATKATTFGTASNTQPGTSAAPTNNIFGSGTQQPFSFGATSNNVTFGSSTQSSSTGSSGFNFGAAQGSAPATPAFGSSSVSQNNVGTSFSFGAAENKPSFGSATAFGQSTSTPGTLTFGTPTAGFSSPNPSFSPATPSFSIGAGSKTSGARQRLQARRQHPRKK